MLQTDGSLTKYKILFSVRISTGSPYENNQNWTVTYSCQEDETAEFRLTELNIEFDFDNLFIDFGDTTLGMFNLIN